METKLVCESDIFKISGKTFVKKPISGWHFFERLSQSISRNQELADEWFMYEAWELVDSIVDVNKEKSVEVTTTPLTEEDYENLSFKARGKLEYDLVDIDANRKITLDEDSYKVGDSEYFITSAGVKFTEAPGSGKHFSEFKTRVAKNEGNAMRWAVITFILCDEIPITEDILKNEISYSDAIILYHWLKGFLD